MDLDTVTRAGSAWSARQGATVAVVCAGILVGAVVRRAWPFYRAMLRDAPALAPTDGRARYDALDGLRGVLCLLVVVHHAAITLRMPAAAGDWFAAGALTPTALLPGGLAVSLFFAVTGFLFYARVVESGRLKTPGRFLVQRALRVGPALVVSAILVLALDAYTVRELETRRTFARFIVQVGTLGAIGTGVIQQNAGVFWTLAYEWAFYLSFPLLGAATVGGLPVWARLLGVFAVASLASNGIGWSGPAMMFLPGVAAVHLMGRPTVRRLASRPSGSAVVALLMVTFPLATRGQPFGFVGVGAVLVCFTLICAGCDVFGLLRLPALRAVGVASYSVYLLHGIGLFAARPLLFRLVDQPSLAWAAICVLTGIVVLVAFASYRWVEHVGIEIGVRLTRGGAPVRA